MGSQVARWPPPSLKSQGLSKATIWSLSSSGEACGQSHGEDSPGGRESQGPGCWVVALGPCEGQVSCLTGRLCRGDMGKPSSGSVGPQERLCPQM